MHKEVSQDYLLEMLYIDDTQYICPILEMQLGY